MEHIAAVLLLVGCIEDFSQCREVPAPVVLFEVEEDCGDALPIAKRRAAGDYPVILGTCVSVDPAGEEWDAELVWEITGEGKLVAFLETVDPSASGYEVAASGHEAGRSVKQR